ncbi:heat shock protein GrpE [alpha proteobacterium U9-1i]|nr:heat shock protein GrpE [alpha proteobacterium U9-1i]
MTDESNAQTQDAPTEAPALDVSALEAEVAKARDEMLRAMAEAENTRRRAERQAQEARAYAIDRFARDLLPVADTLTRALAAAPADADEAIKNVLAGIELTERAMIEAFARHGLKRVGAKGDAFDPNLHQAVAQQPSDQPANTVLEVLQPGYVLGDRTLRAAMVLVSAGAAATATAGVDIKV